MVTVSAEPINPSDAYGLIEKKSSGSIVLHYAVVKENTGGEKLTSSIDYRSEGDTEGELTMIADELKSKWTLEDVLLVRRTGRLGVGDIISLVAASSPNSTDAFEACRHGISRMKKMTTIKKQEIYG